MNCRNETQLPDGGFACSPPLGNSRGDRSDGNPSGARWKRAKPQADPPAIIELAPLMAELLNICELAGRQGAIPSPMLGMARAVFLDPRLNAPQAEGTRLVQPDRFPDAAHAAPVASLSKSLLEAGPAMRWTRNPNYSGAPGFARYLETSAYCDIAGPCGLLENGEIRTGLFLMGSETLYPSHSHPAAEGYAILSGTAEWWREGEDWMPRSPMTSLYHAPFRAHAMRTSAEPMLALYIATGDISTLPEPHPRQEDNCLPTMSSAAKADPFEASTIKARKSGNDRIHSSSGGTSSIQ